MFVYAAGFFCNIMQLRFNFDRRLNLCKVYFLLNIPLFSSVVYQLLKDPLIDCIERYSLSFLVTEIAFKMNCYSMSLVACTCNTFHFIYIYLFVLSHR
jgi:hypothetical protein